MSDITVLTGDEVRAALPMRDAVDVVREAFVQLSTGRAVVPVRQHMALAEHGGAALMMPVYLPEEGLAGLKLVGVHPSNPARGLPMVHAVVLVMDAGTGRAIALIDGEALTALRTGAGTGVATDLLAREEARVVAIYGAGAQAETQLEAVCAVRPIQRAYVVNRTPAHASRFAERMAHRLGIEVLVASSAEALRDADVVCTATASPTPVFSHEDLPPGVHINGVGSYRPDMAEVPPETVRVAYVVVDQRAACLAEAGDLIQPIEQGMIEVSDVLAELGEVAAGVRPGREGVAQVTFFKSVGNAVQDLSTAGAVLARARELELGRVIRL